MLPQCVTSTTIEKLKKQTARSRMDTAENRGSHLEDKHKKITNRCFLNSAAVRTQTPAPIVKSLHVTFDSLKT